MSSLCVHISSNGFISNLPLHLSNNACMSLSSTPDWLNIGILDSTLTIATPSRAYSACCLHSDVIISSRLRTAAVYVGDLPSESSSTSIRLISLLSDSIFILACRIRASSCASLSNIGFTCLVILICTDSIYNYVLLVLLYMYI